MFFKLMFSHIFRHEKEKLLILNVNDVPKHRINNNDSRKKAPIATIEVSYTEEQEKMDEPKLVANCK